MNNFTNAILNNLQQRLGDEYRLLVEMVTKNNGVILTGLIAKKKGTVAHPTLYIDQYYRPDMQEKEIQHIAELLYKKIKEAEMEKEPDLSSFTNFESAKEHLAFKLIHAEKNREYLKTVPHRRLHNLAVIYYYTVQEPPFCGNALIVIKNEHMKHWKVTPEMLHEAALMQMPEKFPYVIKNIEDVMRELLQTGLKKDLVALRESGEKEEVFSDEWANELLEQMTGSFLMEGEKIPMYVLTNCQKLQGAACMLYPGVLKRFGEKIGKDFYVLPSSVHEVILVPTAPETGPEMLKDIVSDINRTQVAPDEILADSVYFYSRKRDTLEWLC